MNHPRTFLFLAVFAWMPFAAAQEPSPEAWVRQTDIGTGLVYDMPMTGSGGNYLAPLPVENTGAKFELFARGTAWDTKIYLLDTKIVRAYSPTASMEIVTEDPYYRGDLASGTYVKRTRADRPISCNIHVSGLVPGSPILAENAVYLGIKGVNYELDTYSSLNPTEYLIHEYNLANGGLSIGPVYHELTTGGLTMGCGEQSYTFVRFASDSIPDTILAQPKVEIWPVATAEIDTLTPGKVFTDRIPPVTLQLKHLYPDSRTYAQVYPGTSALGTEGTIVDGTLRIYGRYYNPAQTQEPTNVPQDVTISINDLSKFAEADGIYTLEVLTETPFFNRDAERLLTVTFEVDRVISSRGQLSSTEKPVDLPVAPPPEEPVEEP